KMVIVDERLERLPVLIETDPHDPEFPPVLLGEPADRDDGLLARMAPARPEVDQNEAAARILQGKLLAVEVAAAKRRGLVTRPEGGPFSTSVTTTRAGRISGVIPENFTAGAEGRGAPVEGAGGAAGDARTKAIVVPARRLPSRPLAAAMGHPFGARRRERAVV